MKAALFSNRDLAKLFLPLVVEQGLEYLVGLTATLLIASIGEAAVSGVSLVDSLMMLLIAAFGALATGGAVVAGQYLGNRQTDRANEAASHLIWLSLVASLLVMALFYLATPLFLDGLFGSITGEVRGHASTYLMLVNASIPAIALYASGAAVAIVPQEQTIPLGGLSFFRNVTISGGPAPVRAYIEELLPDVLEGKIQPGKVFAATLPLERVAEGYRAMNERRVIKALIRPSD